MCYIALPSLRKFAFKLVLWLAVSDLMFSFANLLGDPTDGSARCYLQVPCRDHSTATVAGARHTTALPQLALTQRESVTMRVLMTCQAYLVSFFTLAAVLWTTVIAHTLHTSLHRPRATLGVHKRMRKYHMCVGVRVEPRV